MGERSEPTSFVPSELLTERERNTRLVGEPTPVDVFGRQRRAQRQAAEAPSRLRTPPRDVVSVLGCKKGAKGGLTVWRSAN